MFSSNNGMGDLGQLLASVQDEVRAVKEHIDSLPLFPKGSFCSFTHNRPIPSSDHEVAVAADKV